MNTEGGTQQLGCGTGGSRGTRDAWVPPKRTGCGAIHSRASSWWEEKTAGPPWTPLVEAPAGTSEAGGHVIAHQAPAHLGVLAVKRPQRWFGEAHPGK